MQRSRSTRRALRILRKLVIAALLGAPGVVMAQVTRRSVAFGEAEMPDDPDDLIMHKNTLYEMIDGTYWDSMP